MDDFDTYSKDTGFVYDNVFEHIIGEHILNVDDFIAFIKNVAEEKDVLKAEREQATTKFHKYSDARSTERVYNLFIEELNKRY